MLFNSIQYAVFLAAVLFIYYRTSHRAQNWLLLAASYLFYGLWDPRFLTLIWLSTAVDYMAGRGIRRAREGRARRLARVWLGASITTNLGILGFFKYWGFFVENAQLLLHGVGFQASLPVLEVILPVGISFYTFQTLSYTIDVYRGALEPVDAPIEFALYVAYFPQLVAGPIERARRLLPQITAPRKVRQADVAAGLTLIVIGLVRKVVIADPAGAVADRMFADPARHTALELAAGALAYGLQIYGDFSGYSNIARGSSRLLGIQLVRNFQHPYFAQSPSDFWRRWHVSLSTWLRDYVYIPLGGSRRGRLRTYGNLMVTMLIGGIWHGAAWRFVIWGGLHGSYLVVHRAVASRWRPSTPSPEHSGWHKLASVAGVFILVQLTWIFFRAPDLATAALYLHGLATGGTGGWSALAPVIALGTAMLAIDAPQHLLADELWPLRLRPPLIGVLLGAAAVAILLSGSVERPFIYFQF